MKNKQPVDQLALDLIEEIRTLGINFVVEPRIVELPFYNQSIIAFPNLINGRYFEYTVTYGPYEIVLQDLKESLYDEFCSYLDYIYTEGTSLVETEYVPSNRFIEVLMNMLSLGYVSDYYPNDTSLTCRVVCSLKNPLYFTCLKSYYSYEFIEEVNNYDFLRFISVVEQEYHSIIEHTKKEIKRMLDI